MADQSKALAQRDAYAQNSNDERSTHAKLANGLGWFSIGLGAAQVLAPDKVAQLIGLRDTERTRTMMRSFGVREIAAGVGILMQPQAANWLWGRVAGDVLDIGSLGKALADDGNNRTRLITATVAVAGVTALDVFCGQKLSQENTAAAQANLEPGDIHVTHSIIINKPAAELYNYWHNFENLPRFMDHLDSVQTLDGGGQRSHWVAKAPLGRQVEWDAEVTADEPNTRIAWRSLPSADVENSGEVRFERGPGGRGTLLRVSMRYSPPFGAVGTAVAKLFGEEPKQQLEDDLRNFKQIMEIGERAQSDASIHKSMHPALPPSEPVAELAAQ